MLALEKAHFAEYSIHYDPLHDLLIAHWNYTGSFSPFIRDLIANLLLGSGNDFDGDMAEVAKDPVTQKWWTVTDALQESLVPNATGSGKGAWWLDLEEVFYFNP